ncbi:MAG: DUF1841 family protein [Methylotenera sp.]
MSLFNPSRDQVRQFFFDTWAKFKQKSNLSDLEKIAVEVIQMHPEYHAILDSPDRYMNQQYFPELGETNPFLHLSLHLSVIEQISINQPIGITQVYDKLRQQYNDTHLAQHDLLDCLAETIWQAQRNNAPLDVTNYLDLLKQKSGQT